MLFHFPEASQAPPRRGIVLLVVIAMLTIFAVAGVAFVYYADAERSASKLYREAQAAPQPDIDPEIAFSSFLQQLIFPCSDGGPSGDPNGVFSAMRGHELLRNMFGWNFPIPNTQPYNGTGRWHTGWNPRTGYGFQSPFNAGFYGLPFSASSPGIDDYYLINYQYRNEDVLKGMNFVLDPERLGAASGSANWPYQARGLNPKTNPTKAPPYTLNVGPYVGGFNPSWTYPDMSNIFLGAIKADGTLLVPSFERSRWMPADDVRNHVYHFNTVDPASWKWYLNTSPDGTPQPWLKYEVLRPRPADQLLPGEKYMPDANGNWVLVPPLGKPPRNPFPPPLKTVTPGGAVLVGDVQNAKGWTQGPDSSWMYLGSPVLTLPDGRQYTMLYAPLIVDLDSRVNLNAVGNIRGYNTANPAIPLPVHLSNSGWGPWEINLSQVLSLDKNSPPGLQEWVNLFRGVSAPPGTPPQPWTQKAPGTPLRIPGRYGPDMQPSASGGTGSPPPQYSKIDFDAGTAYTVATGAQPTAPMSLPILVPAFNPNNPASSNAVSCIPTFPKGYENGSFTKGLTTEQTNHASLYNTIAPPLPVPGQVSYDRNFAVANMERILRYGDTNMDGLTSELWQLLPENLGNYRIRQMVTLRSADADQPGVSPALFGAPNFLWPATVTGPNPALAASIASQYSNLVPSAQSTFPWLQSGAAQPFPGIDQLTAATPPVITDFTGPKGAFSDWRNVNASPASAMLNPIPYQFRGRLDLNSPIPVKPNFPLPTRALRPYNPDLKTGQVTPANFAAAQADRQIFATSLFMRLIWATGAYDPMGYTSKKPSQYGQTNALPNTMQVATLRWLAQYAVNMVDYIDNDDVITAFNWVQAYGSPEFIKAMATGDPSKNVPPVIPFADQYVFGNELPRVLINEVYAEFDNWKKDNPPNNNKGGATNYNVNVWVELYNPLPTDTAVSDGGNARLNATVNGTLQAAYQIVLTAPNSLKKSQNPNQPPTPTADPTQPIATTSLLWDWKTASPGQICMEGDNTNFPQSQLNPQANFKIGNSTFNQATINLLGDPLFTKWPLPPSSPQDTTVRWQIYDQTTPVNGINNHIVYNYTPPSQNFTPIGDTNQTIAGPFISASNVLPPPSNLPQTGLKGPQSGGLFVIGPQTSKSKAKGNPSLNNSATGFGMPLLPGVQGSPGSPNTMPYVETSSMSYLWAIPQTSANNAPSPTPPPVTVMVRRLLCPGMPLQQDPRLANYNPWITVDFVENVPLQDFRSFDAKKKLNQPQLGSLNSYGRQQPYDGSQSLQNPSTFVKQNNPSTQLSQMPFAQPNHTFAIYTKDSKGNLTPSSYSQNNPRLPTFDWMVHLDRQLISPMELLHVASCRPHQVTHLFKTTPANSYQAFGHAPYWQLLDSGVGGPESALRRFFEFVETGPHGPQNGPIAGQYLPGKININTIWDEDVFVDAQGKIVLDSVAGQMYTSPIFNALCDARPRATNPLPLNYIRPSNYFDQNDVNAVWTALQSSRTPLLGASVVGPGDQPFKGLGVGNFNPPTSGTFTLAADGKGIADTIFRASPTRVAPALPQRLFEVIRHDFVYDASKTSPIVITSPGHGLSTGAVVSIQNCKGNTAANGTWTITVPLLANGPLKGQPDPNHFSLTSSTGNGVYTNKPPGPPTPGTWRHVNPHPVQRYELYNKIYNQMTTRSNVFAVWVTVGFFEVTDSTPGQLPKLGAEIGLAEGRNIRHRMFAIVDRSQVKQNPGPPPPGVSFNPHVVQPDPSTLGNPGTLPWPVLVPPGTVNTTITPIQIVPHFSIID